MTELASIPTWHVHEGDCRDLLRALPAESVQLVVTSPPYNIGKAYEERRALDDYLAMQDEVIALAVRALAEGGSICWEVGNHIVGPAEILPLDIALHPLFAKRGLKLRNRIVWHFEHGLHCKRRFSGRHETILWYTKGDGDYAFDLDAVRVPQKYPGKRAWKGPRAGELSGNPLGKNPGDVWILPNVKSNHVEKTIHPCQFPVELVERLVLALTRPGDVVLDPFGGVGSAPCAAVLNGRRGIMAELDRAYARVARERLAAAERGELRVRPRDRSVHVPTGREAVARMPEEWKSLRA